MLIITRRIGEKLIIGEDIVVTILGEKNGQIQVGIDAPIDIEVRREEFWSFGKELKQLINGTL